MNLPDDANDLRGMHFKQLLGKSWVLLLIGVLAIVAGAVGAAAVGPAIGGIALVAVIGIGIGIVFWVADKRAADDFFEVYAQQRGLTLVHDRGQLPPRTPLLRKGDDRYTERTMLGPIGDGFDGTLALYTYEEEHTDSDGHRQTDYYRYTVGLVEVPECSRFVPELYCQRKFGFRALEGLEDVFRTSKERVTLESEALLDRYEIFSGKQQDAVWLRRLFAPTFIVWLTDSAPEKFAFELVDGTLCCYVKGHKETAWELDAVASASAAVAARLREESGQTSLGSAGT
ncbi:MAG: hypothetical protein R2725_13940 [Solirubrobacterales bacterium]